MRILLDIHSLSKYLFTSSIVYGGQKGILQSYSDTWTYVQHALRTQLDDGGSHGF